MVLVEAFYRTQFAGASGSVWQELLIDAGFGLGAFLVGALTTYLYVICRERALRVFGGRSGFANIWRITQSLRSYETVLEVRK